jgi:hypothetical protein
MLQHFYRIVGKIWIDFRMVPLFLEVYSFLQEKLDLSGVFICLPVVGEQFCQVLAVIIVVIGQSGELILKPLLRINATCRAGSQQGINYRSILCRIMVATEHVILPANGQRANGVFNQVIIDPVTAIQVVAGQSVEQVIGI